MYTLEAASPDIQKCVDQVELTSIRDPMRRTDKRLASMEIRPSGNTGIREYGNTGIRKCATYGVNVNSLLPDWAVNTTAMTLTSRTS